MNLMELAIKIGVEDKATSAINKLTHKVGDGLKAAANVGIGAIAAVGSATAAYVKSAIDAYAEFEQLEGGAQKIFDKVDYSKIKADAYDAYKTLGISATEYLSVINDTGATFAATMGDEAGYEVAKKGLKAISDYASGTGKSVSELSQKFTLITKSTSSYQSIADQFSGILPATSKDFLEQAQAAGFLNESYTKLTEVPVAEYQSAVAGMLEYGTEKLGLQNNTAKEAATTIQGSTAAMKAAWENLKIGISTNSEDMEMLIGNFTESTYNAATNIVDRAVITIEGIKSVFSDSEKRQKFVQLGKDLLGKIGDGIKTLLGVEDDESPIGAAKKLVGTLIEKVKEKAPMVLELGKKMMITLIAGLLDINEDEVSFAYVTGWLAGSLYEALSDAINYAWEWLTSDDYSKEREEWTEDFLSGVMHGSETLRNSGQFSWGYNPDEEIIDVGFVEEFGKATGYKDLSTYNKHISVNEMIINTTGTTADAHKLAEDFMAALEEMEAANG